MNKKTIIIILSLVGIVLFAIFCIWVFASSIYRSQNTNKEITNYDGCVDAGGRIRESYPEVCVLEDGSEFVQPVDPQSIPR